MKFIFVIAALVVDQIAHSLCDESSVILFTLNSFYNNSDIQTNNAFGIYRTVTSLTNCIGAWVIGTAIDKCTKLSTPLMLSILGTSIGYASMSFAKNATSFIALVAFANLFGSVDPIISKIVNQLDMDTGIKASVFSISHATSAFATVIVPPIGAYVSMHWFLQAPFLLMAVLSSSLLVIFCLYTLTYKSETYHTIKNISDAADEKMPIFKRIIARECLTFAAKCNNTTFLIILKDIYGYDMYACALYMSLSGFICGIMSLISCKLLLYVPTELAVKYTPLFMICACACRTLFQLKYMLLFSIFFDCVCGTIYYPAFDAIFFSTISSSTVGKWSAILQTISLFINSLSPLLIVNYFHSINPQLPFIVGICFACLSFLIHQLPQ
jgi:predicted MFS family arabinose efflux permease